jgi:hypothetical protein
MSEDATPVVIGGQRYLVPPMSFYCLKRAWPHIRRLSELGAFTQAAAAAELQVKMAVTQEQHEAATQNLATAMAIVEREDADFVGQTDVALHIIVAALALESPPPSYDALSRVLQPDEIGGVHIACAALMDGSGLVQSGARAGEALAAARMMPLLNGSESSLN